MKVSSLSHLTAVSGANCAIVVGLAFAIASALGMPAVVVPPRAGVLSAVGVLGASRQADVVRSWPGGASVDGLDDALMQLAAVASRSVGGGALVDVAVDCRYAGQSHELTVPSVAEFAAEHSRRNGYTRPDGVVEVVALRASARLAPAVDVAALPSSSLPARASGVVGPCVLSEPDCTVWVAEGWRADVHEASGSWVLTRC
jgi:N-methylhydantoinase A/oxoprolinase/acetone carboxylase beta subunit